MLGCREEGVRLDMPGCSVKGISSARRLKVVGTSCIRCSVEDTTCVGLWEERVR